MAYKSARLNLVSQGITRPRSWVYDDTGATVADGVASGFFTDAGPKGVEVGDVLDFRDNNTGIRVTGRFTVANDTGTGEGTFVQDTQ